MKASDQVLVLVGESTKHLKKFVGWEIDLAINLVLPIIVVNLNDKRHMDDERLHLRGEITGTKLVAGASLCVTNAFLKERKL